MRSVIVIPSRYGSSRFPGKPLAMISGKSLLQRVWEIANAALSDGEVVVATDDERIGKHCSTFGARYCMTASSHKTGTDRVWEAVSALPEQPDLIVNLQGDAVLTPPWIISAVVEEMQRDVDVAIATPAVAMMGDDLLAFEASKESGAVGGTTVVFSKDFEALYFSKSIIPFRRNSVPEFPTYRHIGLYAYRFEALKRFVSLEPSTLETTEGLEQLRALENDIPIRVVPVDYQGRRHWSVDAPEDVPVAERIISEEGELT